MTTETGSCHHCGSPVDDSPYRVVLQGMEDDHALPICRSCQGLRQGGQLPVDLLVQQWSYAREGPAVEESESIATILIRLECLGCGDALSPVDRPGPAVGEAAVPARRLPDGSLITECGACQRTNLLQRRGQQMVAVRLW